MLKIPPGEGGGDGEIPPGSRRERGSGDLRAGFRTEPAEMNFKKVFFLLKSCRNSSLNFLPACSLVDTAGSLETGLVPPSGPFVPPPESPERCSRLQKAGFLPGREAGRGGPARHRLCLRTLEE